MPTNADPVHRMQSAQARARERQILEWLDEGKTQSQIARDLGLSRQRISELVKRARERKGVGSQGAHR